MSTRLRKQKRIRPDDVLPELVEPPRKRRLVLPEPHAVAGADLSPWGLVLPQTRDDKASLAFVKYTPVDTAAGRALVAALHENLPLRPPAVAAAAVAHAVAELSSEDDHEPDSGSAQLVESSSSSESSGHDPDTGQDRVRALLQALHVLDDGGEAVPRPTWLPADETVGQFDIVEDALQPPWGDAAPPHIRYVADD